MSRREKVLGYGRQNIDHADIDAVVAVLNSDFLTQGMVVDRFEGALAERVGARHAVVVSSGTAALHLACLAGGIGPGDWGLTSAVTFAASANCLLYAGGDAGFVDIDPDVLGMSPSGFQRALKEKAAIRIVIPVHFAGLACAAADIRALAKAQLVIEDAAHALGGTYACGKPVGCGAYSDMAIFSFHPVKTITTGEGGAIVTNDAGLARRLRVLRNHGIERDPAKFVAIKQDARAEPWYHEQQLLGFNYRMTDIQAALGLSQLARLDAFLLRRRDIVHRYDEAFSSLPNIVLPQSGAQERVRSAHHLYIVMIDFERLGVTRGELMKQLKAQGIGSQVHYIPVYRHPFYAKRYGVDPALFPEAERYSRSCLSLPLYPGLTDEDVESVVTAVTKAVGKRGMAIR